MKHNTIEDTVQNGTNNLKTAIKNRMFDFIAVGILIAMLALNLGVLELREITWLTFANILLECVPFYLTSVLLSINFYHKGTFTGKSTEKFTAISKQYSDIVNDLTGHQVETIPDFCEEYNDGVLRQLQTNLLKRIAITYERFNNETYDANGKLLVPLKILTKKELRQMFSKERVTVILKAKYLKIKGLNENLLLGNSSLADSTDIGDDETAMDKRNTINSAVRYLASTALLSLIAIRDVLAWGWAGLLITVFKLVYVLCSSYMKHFTGYNDITVKLANHITRKTDILKHFAHWYSNKYCSNTTSETVTQLEMQL